jgi:hypothetical protein
LETRVETWMEGMRRSPDDDTWYAEQIPGGEEEKST